LPLSVALTPTIGGVNVQTAPQTIVLMPCLTLFMPPSHRACC
jgi:hypothetical protein